MPDIDDVVRAVLSDTPRMTDDSFTTTRERVLSGGRQTRRHRRWPWLAAAVAVVVAAALVVPTFGGEHAPQAASAATVLTKAADVLQAKDVPLQPGQFRYVRTESTMLGSAEGCDYRAHDLDEIWIPQDPEAEWLLRKDYGRIEWLTCEKPESDTLPRRFQEEYRAQYGTFVLDGGLNPPEPPGWYNLTPEFLASLPRDPAVLYELVARDYAGSAEPAKATFQHFTHILYTGAAMPADLLAAMYRAMTHIPGVEITEEFANVDGRTGTAIGLSMGSRKDVREDLVIDPETGQLIGRRSLAPNGSVAGTDVITTRITDELGG